MSDSRRANGDLHVIVPIRLFHAAVVPSDPAKCSISDGVCFLFVAIWALRRMRLSAFADGWMRNRDSEVPSRCWDYVHVTVHSRLVGRGRRGGYRGRLDHHHMARRLR